MEFLTAAERGRFNGRPRKPTSEEDANCGPNSDEAPPRLPRFNLFELCERYPKLNPPVVDGLFRQGETVNIISQSKIGKSWLIYGLALSIISGRPWLRRFATTAGRVLLIDNELHPQTIADRIPRVGDALGFDLQEYGWALEVIPLRGNLRGIGDVSLDLANGEPGFYQLIVLDAKYRFAIAGTSENDNASEALFYNTIDRLAAATDSAIALIHHGSKGSQADKRITDVGAGAGAQSRAADCHLILREHEQAGVMVLDAAVRSFAPVEPLPLRWEFPLWVRADDVDPGKLKGRLNVNEQRQADRDREGIDQIVKSLMTDGDATARELRRRTAISKDRCDRLLAKLQADGHVNTTTIKVRGNDCLEYHVVDV